MGYQKTTPLIIDVLLVNNSTQTIIGKGNVRLNTPEQQSEIQASMCFDVHPEFPDWQIATLTPASNGHDQPHEITLCLKKAKASNPQDPYYHVPSVAACQPDTDIETEFFDFTYELNDKDWRQHEFIPKVDQPCVEIELHSIRMIWEHYRLLTENGSYIFSRTHVREKIGTPCLQLKLKELQAFTGNVQIGALKLSSQNEYIENGFAIPTDDGIFYGTALGETIITLCFHAKNIIPSLKSLEITQKIAKQYNLIFVDWCKCEISVL